MARYRSKNWRNESGNWEWERLQKSWKLEREIFIVFTQPPIRFGVLSGARGPLGGL